MRMDDGAIVRAVLDGQIERFADLVDRHSAAVFRLVRATIGHDPDAEDIAQETFLASFRGLARLRDPSRYRAHLLGIASRRLIDHLRRKKVRSKQVALTEEPIAPVARDLEPLLDSIQQIVEQMEPQTRLIFALRHQEGLSCVQIASMLHLPKGTIYSRISRMHAKIRRSMEVAEE